MKKTGFFAALCLAAALACGMMLAACSSGPNPEEVISQDIATQFDPIKNLDQAAVDELAQDAASGADLSDFGIDGAEYIKAMLGGFDYSIVSVNVAEDGQSATAVVDVTCKSFNAANDRANEISEEFAASDEIGDMSMDDLNKKIGEILMQAMNETEPSTVECEFQYNLVDGTWTMSDSAESEIYNAFFS